MVSNNHAYFSNKKITVSFVLSLLVFFIHFRLFSAFSDAGSFLSGAFRAIMPLTHVAVPLFFVISGALFYRNYTLAATMQKWKSRFISLCIPYLVWNTIWLVLALLGNYTPLGAFTGGVKVAFSVKAVLAGIFLHGQFLPFWFLLQLILLTALCPVIYLLMKNKWVGIITIAVFYILYCFGFRLNATLFADTSMVVFYLIGAWIGIHSFDLFASRRNKSQAAVGFFVYVLCCLFVGVESLLPEWFPYTQVLPLVKLISCVGFWISFDFFQMRKCPNFMKESFLVYAMHSLVGAAFAKILQIVLPSGQAFLILVAVLSFVLTIVFICTFGMFLGKYMPWAKRILSGKC